jgi:hypothetical protein
MLLTSLVKIAHPSQCGGYILRAVTGCPGILALQVRSSSASCRIPKGARSSSAHREPTRHETISEGRPVRADDESLRCGPQKIEWVAGHKGQNGVGRCIYQFCLIGFDHSGGVHSIAVSSVDRRQGDFIICAHVARRPEKSTPGTRDRDIPLPARRAVPAMYPTALCRA